MTASKARWTSARELTVYIATHALGIAISFLMFPAILADARRAGVQDIPSLAVVLHVLMALVVLALFVVGRRFLASGAPVAAQSSQPFIAAIPQPQALSSGVPTPPAPAPGGTMAQPGSILGVVSIVCGVLGLMPGFGILLSIGGLICGLIGRGQAKAAGNASGATLNKVGIILSSLTLIIAFVVLIVAGGALIGLGAR